MIICYLIKLKNTPLTPLKRGIRIVYNSHTSFYIAFFSIKIIPQTDVYFLYRTQVISLLINLPNNWSVTTKTKENITGICFLKLHQP
jgi:hypothetical protein